MTSRADTLRMCCERCRIRLASLTDAGVPEELAAFIADPLLGVSLLDPRWVERFDAKHPRRSAP